MLDPCPMDHVSTEMVYFSEGNFCLDAHEVSNAAYQCYVDKADSCDLPSDGNSKSEPVTNVSYWKEAYDYCEFVEKRLPTRSEWNHAAQNLTTEKFNNLNGGVDEWLNESDGHNLKFIKKKEFTGGEKFQSASSTDPYGDIGFRCAVEVSWLFQLLFPMETKN